MLSITKIKHPNNVVLCVFMFRIGGVLNKVCRIMPDHNIFVTLFPFLHLNAILINSDNLDFSFVCGIVVYRIDKSYVLYYGWK